MTPQTIRKDLNDLCDRASADPHPWRCAVPIRASRIWNMRRGARLRAGKGRDRRRRRSLIPDKASLFINIGTTTEAVSKAPARP
jgi:DeoR family glycerol-3-phosphate regulon repressor